MSQDDFQSPRALARFILREALFGSLATHGEGGYPDVALVALAALPDGSPAMLLSNLTRPMKNIRKDPRASLLFLERPQVPDLLAGARLTITGKVVPLEKDAARTRYRIRHPDAAKDADSADFGFWRLQIEQGHVIAPSGKATDLDAADLLGSGSTKPAAG